MLQLAKLTLLADKKSEMDSEKHSETISEVTSDEISLPTGKESEMNFGIDTEPIYINNNGKVHSDCERCPLYKLYKLSK